MAAVASALAEKPYSFLQSFDVQSRRDIAVTVAGFHGPQNIRVVSGKLFSIKLVGSRRKVCRLQSCAVVLVNVFRENPVRFRV